MSSFMQLHRKDGHQSGQAKAPGQTLQVPETDLINGTMFKQTLQGDVAEKLHF